MARLTTIDRLPSKDRELVRALRGRGETIDAIRAELGRRGVRVSRSALGRHVRHLDAAGELGTARELAGLRRCLGRIEAQLAEMLHEVRS